MNKAIEEKKQDKIKLKATFVTKIKQLKYRTSFLSGIRTDYSFIAY